MDSEHYESGASELLAEEGAFTASDAQALLDRLGIDSTTESPLTKGAIDRALFRFGVDVGAKAERLRAETVKTDESTEHTAHIAASDEVRTPETRILACLERVGEADLDQLCEMIDGLSPTGLQTALMMLSVSGRIALTAGGRYRYIPADGGLH